MGMTNEEALDQLKEWQYMMSAGDTTNPIHQRNVETINYAIKALEQQPYRKSEKVVAEVKLDKKFIDEAVQEDVKDIKQNYIPKDVLDKIRAEIEAEKKSRCFDDMFPYITGLDDAIYIIDKYKAESEDNE